MTAKSNTFMRETKNLYNFTDYYYSEGKSQSRTISKPRKVAIISLLQRGCSIAFHAYGDIDERFALTNFLKHQSQKLTLSLNLLFCMFHVYWHLRSPTEDFAQFLQIIKDNAVSFFLKQRNLWFCIE